MNTSWQGVFFTAALIATCLFAVDAHGQRGQGGPGRGKGPGAGFRGPRQDAQFVADRDDFHYLLENHGSIRREVKLLKNGVETITESDNPQVAATLQKHVRAMYKRVEELRPIRLRDPLFAAVFQHAKEIKIEFKDTQKGIHVLESSDNPEVVRLIQEHAKVVSLFVKNGFDEAHKDHAVPGVPAQAAPR